MALELSVIICTHNPRPDYLRRVLEALRTQTLPVDQWELIVVDNASEHSVASRFDISWHPRGRHAREDELGLAYARQRGMREALSELLVFVDDDNVLALDYLAEALNIRQEWPQLGVWGGSIVPEFEVEPPAHLTKYLRLLALRKIDAPRWSNVATCADVEPWGAGLCVRSSVASAYRQHYRQSKIHLTGRSGTNLISGEDMEICYVARAASLGMGLFPELTVTHLIPEARLKEEYLVRLAQALHFSHLLLAFSWRGITPRSPFAGIELLRSIKNITTRRKLDRRVYLSNLRAVLQARATIAHAQK